MPRNWFSHLQKIDVMIPLLIVLAVLGNMLTVPLFFGVHFIFGSIIVLIMLVRCGFAWGTLAALIASSYTLILWSHPYAIVIFTLEALWVGLWIKWRGAYNLVWYDLMFWAALGIWLVWIFYHFILELSVLTTWLIALKQFLNGLFNAIIANLFVIYTRIYLIAEPNKHQTITLQEVIQNVLMMTIIFAVSAVMIVNSRAFLSALNEDIHEKLGHSHQQIKQFITAWSEHNLALLSIVAKKIGRLTDDATKQLLLQDTYELSKDISYLEIYTQQNQQPILTYPPHYTSPAQTKMHLIHLTLPIATEQPLYIKAVLDLTHLSAKLTEMVQQKHVFNVLLKTDDTIIQSIDTPDKMLAKNINSLQLTENKELWTPPALLNASGISRWSHSFYVYRTERSKPFDWQLITTLSLKPYQHKLYRFYVYNMSVSLISILIIFALSHAVSHFLVRTLKKISLVTEKITQEGSFSKVMVYPQSRLDEVNTLSEQFEKMAVALNKQLKKSAQVNEILQCEIIEREEIEETLLETNEKLSKTLESLQTTQQELIHTEKMAMIGQLVASIAHEINTPLTMINLSIQQMDDFLNISLSELIFLLNTMPEAQRILFYRLTQEAMDANKQELSSREQRQQRRKLLAKLADYTTEDAQKIADILVDINMYENFERYLVLLEQNNCEDVLNMVYQLANFKRNAHAILTASERASKIVFALRNYARQQQQTEKTSTNILESIEMVLTLYQNQFRKGVQIVKHYKIDNPVIDCYPDELNQVWMNLVQNALQAMNYHGVLKVEVAQQQQDIDIQITDNGNGIPPEIFDKIFDPFFTTKPPGEGTGLGLDIVQKIIEKHQGHISVKSQPGQTCFTITLPYHA